MNDLVERLRQYALPDPFDEREVMHSPLLREAADEITRLRAENAELRANIKRLLAGEGLGEYQKDAERYRWLRANERLFLMAVAVLCAKDENDPTEVDDAIDAAMAQEKK